ncbi:MAG TPA: alpha/beta hydrolase [Thiomicrospira sp.]|nr:alpha/beta hydrolase [Thiomicrospira sp.]
MFLFQTMLLAGFFLFGLNSQAAYQTPVISIDSSVSGNEAIPFLYHAQGDTDSPKVILLGGGPGFSSWNLEPIQQQIAKMGYRVLLTDMLGIGENHQIQPQNILHSWVEQINQILSNELKKDESAILVGHSWGALMAMLYAKAHNDKVSKLILLNPVDPHKASMQQLTEQINQRNNQFVEQDWNSEENWNNEVDNINQDIEHLTLRQIQQVLPTYFMDYDLGTQYAKQFTVRDFDIELNIKAWKEYDHKPLEYHEINGFSQPISFIDCHQDYLMPYNLNAMQKKMTFSNVTLIDQCGHFPWIEQPKDFYHALEKDLRSNF